MKRLRAHSMFENNFYFLIQEQKSQDLSIIFLNIQSFNSNFGFQKVDIILLVECHNVLVTRQHASRLFEKKHRLEHFTSGTNEKYSCGQMCYIRNEHSNRVKFLADNAGPIGLYEQRNQRDLCELSLFEYKHTDETILLILSIYKHPKYDVKNFFLDLNQFLDKNIQESHRPVSLYVVGDFNLDFNKKEEKNIREAMDVIENKFYLIPLIRNAKTFKWMKDDRVHFSKLDWAFKNQNFKFQVRSIAYDLWFSDR
ncbi:unnamed protein product [Brachionus calyciflorus]|uniref:Endonuclease/exonuclease/phosphatase domain-containing protein n=1 Tax=Brachionus calyciflorus TaxID=104777 RepID=A0A814RP09_9BILA|nr:unnamed protein product [Brachionus calyciflorus]